MGSKKRRRTDTTTNNDTHLDNKHEVFTQWSRDRGVIIGSVKAASLPGRGIGLMTTAEIKQGEQILFVPQKAMFKPDSPALGKGKREFINAKASPQAQLAINLYSELQSPSAPLQNWQATWPSREDLKASLPLCWPSKLQDMLPDSVQQPLARQREDYKKDVSSWLAFCHTHSHDGDRDSELFEHCWMIVNSRSFHFKPPGIKPGFMVLCPFIDYLNHGPSGTGANVRQTPKGYEVTADRDYAAGEEVLATYGAHPNDKLLVHYGFVNPRTPGSPSDDDIRLDHVIIPALSEAKRESLQDVGFLGGYALLPRSNELCFKTQVAIRAMLLTANEWEYFMTNGEDMSGDQSENVNAWIMPLMSRYRDEAEKALKVLDEQSEPIFVQQPVAVRLLRERWQQIREAIDNFVDAN